MARLTRTERIEILMMIGYGDRRRTHEEACALFNAEHPNREPITRSTVTKMHSKFRNTGDVKDLEKSGRPKVATEDKALDVLLTVTEQPHISTRQLMLDHEISQRSVLRILHKNKFHPYKVKLVQELSEDDFDRRVQFCEEIMDMCNNNPHFLNCIVFSDEATFSLNGAVNRHNCRYWSHHNPHWMEQTRTQYPQKVNVWAGIVRNRILGPFFFDGTLNAAGYLDFLRFQLVPALALLFPNPVNPDIPDETIWYQQDGAPPHYGIQVRNYLDFIFENRWIGRRGRIEWPARSPDLNPLDFFLWGHLKGTVYKNRPQNLEQLRNRIREEIRAISVAEIQNVLQSFYHRIGQCQVVHGQQFEHFF